MRQLIPILLILNLWLPASSQSLQLRVEDSIAAGQEGTAVIDLDSPQVSPPVALQWEIQVPLSIRLDPRSIQPGSAAVAAGKSVKCSILANRSGNTSHCRCILAGGAMPIANGPVATLKYRTVPKLRPGRYDMNLRNAIAVSESAKKASIKDSTIAITVSK